MACIAKHVLQRFFPQGRAEFNFATTGMILRQQGVEHHLRCEFGCWLADEKALKEVVSCKGSSGSKPCVACKNVVGRLTPQEGGYLVHYTCGDRSKFDPHTFESLSYMASALAEKRGHVSRAEFQLLEQCYGLTYVPEAILFDGYFRTVARFPGTIFWDWMHCLVASGGVAQYQCNQLLNTIVAAGISLKSIDEFSQKVAVPASFGKLTKTFFQDRTVARDDAHIKAFASGMLAVMPILGLFLHAVVRPTGLLQEGLIFL
jgi:hypothetical protein